jgi:hypothetical protein
MESKKSITVRKLEKRILPAMRKMAEEISHEFPRVKTNVLSWSVGSSTAYQGYNIGIECSLPENSSDRTNTVALTIQTMHLTTLPKINAVYVCWSDGSLEEELFLDPIEITEDVFGEIEVGLPRMYNRLKESIRRGYPSEP